MDILYENTKVSFILWCCLTVVIPMVIPWVIYKVFLHYTSSLKKLIGKVVVITGASSGLGEALSHTFYSSGCRVILASRRLNELERVKSDLVAKTSPLTFPPVVMAVDLSDSVSIQQFSAKALAVYGYVDILINNGGMSYRGEVASTTCDVDYKVMLVNYFGQVSLTKAFLPSMMRQSNGYIVFISSVQGKLAIPFRSAYTASKHALQAFCDTLRAEVHKNNIKVMSASPGYIQTKLSMNAITANGEPYGVMDDSTLNGYSSQYVAQRILKAVLQEKKEVIIAPISPRLAIYIRTLLPSLYFYIMRRRACSSKMANDDK